MLMNRLPMQCCQLRCRAARYPSSAGSKPACALLAAQDVPSMDEKALKKALAHQPVSVAIEADQRAFQVCVAH